MNKQSAAKNNTLRVVFFGTPEFVVPVLETLTKHHTVVAVVTTPDELQGRKKILTPPPVKQFALDNNIPVFQPDTIADLRAISEKHLASTTPDLFVVAAYGKIIPEEIINLPTYGSINLHPSRLPDYRGPSPIQETILNGEKGTSVTLIKMDEDVDHGPILATDSLAIATNDTFLSLAQKLFLLGAQLLISTIERMVQNTLVPEEQHHENATFTSHIQKEDGYFAIDSPPSPEQLDLMIRAYYPWPTAWTKMVINDNEKIVKFLPEGHIQVAGGKKMLLKDFLNGYPKFRTTIDRLFPTAT